MKQQLVGKNIDKISIDNKLYVLYTLAHKNSTIMRHENGISKLSFIVFEIWEKNIR